MSTLLIVGGIIGIFLSLMMDTSVGGFGGDRIHNISLAHQQTVYIMISSVVLLTGIILKIFKNKNAGSNNSILNSEPIKVCPYCSEDIKFEAKFCRFCGKEQPQIKISQDDMTGRAIKIYGSLWKCRHCATMMHLDSPKCFKCGGLKEAVAEMGPAKVQITGAIPP